MKTVPVFEPEVIAAGDEKAATTAIKMLTIAGVEIESRYGKADELQAVGNIIDQLCPAARAFIERVWINSKNGWVHVTLRYRDETAARIVAELVEKGFLQNSGGHSGIDICAPQTET